ncbi:NAD-dependent epimerase/dehydratase family protein [Aneurinibacillus migulanus]
MILVVGGAGYIGSHVVRELCNRGEQVVILDNFINVASLGDRFTG